MFQEEDRNKLRDLKTFNNDNGTSVQTWVR